MRFEFFRFEKMLDDFEAYHRSFGNRVFHYLGISLVTIPVLGLVDRIPLGLPQAGPAALFLGATFALDLVICPAFALPVLLAGSAFLAVSRGLPPAMLAACFAAGWFFQLAGHRFAERNRPAFTRNLAHLFVGPRWMMKQWLQPLGLRIDGGRHLSRSTDLPDLLRWALARAIPAGGAWAERRVRALALAQPRTQERLRERYGVSAQAPAPYTEELRARIHEVRARLRGSVLITTSGSTSRPKEIVYDRERLRLFKRTSMLSALQIFRRLGAESPAVFVFASLQKDDSFASLVVARKPGLPGLFKCVTEPGTLLFHPLLQKVVAAHGANAARLWILCLTDPSLLYATNPSTLAVFFEEVSAGWPGVRAMFRDFVEGRGAFEGVGRSREWTRILSRAGRGGYGERMRRLAGADALPETAAIMPSLKGFVCWDGGYVRSFLTRVTRFLPPERFFHVPMFSMSTETLQTQTFVQEGEFRYLPLARHVLFEFHPEGAEPSASNLLLAHELEEGKAYGMVVTDKWGLRRYDTQDVFLCRGKVLGLPDLAFLKRRGLNYSFTGEKLTGEQAVEAFETLLRERPALARLGAQLSLVPSRPADGVPHYVLLIAAPGPGQAQERGDAEAAARFDAILGAINGEYRDKRESRRLGPVRAFRADYDQVARRFDPKTRTEGDARNRSWESQFKLTPITQKLWQDLGLE